MVDTISNRTFKIMIFFFLIYFFPSFLPLSRLNFQLFFQLIVIKIQRDREQIIYDRLTSNESIPKLRFENRSKRNITRESDTVHALSLNAISWSVYRLNRRIDPFENRQAEPISHSRTSSQSPLTSHAGNFAEEDDFCFLFPEIEAELAFHSTALWVFLRANTRESPAASLRNFISATRNVEWVPSCTIGKSMPRKFNARISRVSCPLSQRLSAFRDVWEGISKIYDRIRGSCRREFIVEQGYYVCFNV